MPDAIDSSSSNKDKFVSSAIVGMGLGVGMVLIAAATFGVKAVSDKAYQLYNNRAAKNRNISQPIPPGTPAS